MSGSGAAMMYNRCAVFEERLVRMSADEIDVSGLTIRWIAIGAGLNNRAAARQINGLQK